MRYSVKNKQPNSKMCFVCGLKNSFGLHTSFYELENGDLMAVFSPKPEHQGYPNRLHGGMAAAILDETIGRAIMIGDHPDFWGVTIEFTSRYKKPIPLDREVRVISRITRNSSRIFEGTGEVILEDGAVAVEGRGKYLKLPLSKIVDFDVNEQEWQVVPSPDDPSEIEI
jgi:acyl-coenzyme A thioesterase PaaI-like protein